MWEHIPQSHQNGSTLTTISMIGHNYYHLWGPALTFDHVGANPTVISEWICTYIWSCGNQSHSHIRINLHLYLTMEGTDPITMSEGLTNSSLPLGRNLDLENTKLLPEVLKLHSSHLSHRITSWLIMSKDNLGDSPGLNKSKDDLQDWYV